MTFFHVHAAWSAFSRRVHGGLGFSPASVAPHRNPVSFVTRTDYVLVGKEGSGGSFPGTTFGPSLRSGPPASPTLPKTAESLLMGRHLRREAAPVPKKGGWRNCALFKWCARLRTQSGPVRHQEAGRAPAGPLPAVPGWQLMTGEVKIKKKKRTAPGGKGRPYVLTGAGRQGRWSVGSWPGVFRIGKNRRKPDASCAPGSSENSRRKTWCLAEMSWVFRCPHG